MAEEKLSPELYQRVRDFNRFKKDFTWDEVGRRIGAAGSIAGGMDPRQAREYHLGQSPYRLTRAEFDHRLAQYMMLEERAAKLEAAAAKGDAAAAKELRTVAAAAQKSSDQLRVKVLDNVGDTISLRMEKGLEELAQYRTPKEVKLKPQVTTALRSINPQATILDYETILDPIAAQLSELPAGATARGFLEKVAGERDLSLADFLIEIDNSAQQLQDPRALAFNDDIKAKLADTSEQEKKLEDEIDALKREAYFGWGSGGDPLVSAKAVAQSKAAGQEPNTEDIDVLKQAVMSFKETPPIRGERDQLMESPEFQRYMREFFDVGEDEERTFSDIEKKGALRSARIGARQRAKEERGDVRSRLRAQRRGESRDEFLPEEELATLPEKENIQDRIESERDREDPKTGGYSAAEAAQVAVSEQTSATGVGEDSTPAQDTYSYFQMKSDPNWRYRVGANGRFETAKTGTNNWVNYPSNPFDDGGLVDKIEASTQAGELTQGGKPFTPELSSALFEMDIFSDAREKFPTGSRETQPSSTKAEAPTPTVDETTGLYEAAEDEQEIAPVTDVPPVYQPLHEFTDEQLEAVEKATGRVSRSNLGQMVLEGTRNRYPQIPMRSGAEVAKEQAEVWDIPPENPLKLPDQVLKTNLDAAGISEEVYGDGHGLVGEPPVSPTSEADVDRKIRSNWEKGKGKKVREALGYGPHMHSRG
jgi:hypothetical protein